MRKKNTQPNATNPSKIDITDFLDCIFGPMGEGENVLFWAVSGSGLGFPLDEAQFNKIMRRSSKPHAAYFGCSTMRLDGDKLYNRQSQFAGYYVLILDDIGTGPGAKRHPDDLPKGLPAPTFRIETSPGNEQWGYVLKIPIRELELAKAFQREIVEKTGVDAGGLMPNKAVRLPCGFNLKEDRKNPDGSLFECRLLEFEPDRLFGPTELLVGSGSGLTWATLKERGATQTRRMGTTAHRQKAAYLVGLDGISDPVLDYLNAEKQIVSEGFTDWVEIICPGAEKHTSGGGTAGYKPIGVGSDPDRRAFHCFHDSCSALRTPQFLVHVFEGGGPRCSPKSVIDHMVSRFVVDPETDRIIDVKGSGAPGHKLAGFKNEHATTIFVPNDKGEMKGVSEYSLFLNDANRLRISGWSHVVGGASLLDGEAGAKPRVNSWGAPEWGDGEPDMNVVEPFIEFMHYLKPQGNDAERFLDHLAAKAQDPRYRGPGIIQHTPVQGIGRGTEETILTAIFGEANTRSIQLKDIVKSEFNSGWVLADMVFIAEAKDGQLSAREEFGAYEVLKKLVEPNAVRTLFKMKSIPNRAIETCFSLLISSQHSDAIPMDSGDTRFWRIENATRLWAPEKYQYLIDEWMPSRHSPWVPYGDVWRWLRRRGVDESKLLVRQKARSLEEEIELGIERRAGIDPAVDLCILFAERELKGAVFINEFVAGIRSVEESLGLDYSWEKRFRRNLIAKTRTVKSADGGFWRVKIDGKQDKVRVTVEPRGQAFFDAAAAPGSREEAVLRAVLRDRSRSTISENLRSFIRDFIDNPV